MALHVKHLRYKLDNLGLIPGSYQRMKGKNQLHKLLSDLMYAMVLTCPYTRQHARRKYGVIFLDTGRDKDFFWMASVSVFIDIIIENICPFC